MKFLKIDENTKVVGRFAGVISPRGLNIYNPLFQELGINALYLLFVNPEPKVLFQGLRNLNLAGAVTVGFETDPRLKKLVDEFDDMSKYLGKVGFVKNTNGVVRASYQGGEGMFRTILKSSPIKGKNLTIVGAGQVAKSLLFFISKQKNLPQSVTVFNRTIKKAIDLEKEFGFVKEIGSLGELKKASGDVLINLTHIGGKEKDNVFNESIVSKFHSVVDVTFETENTNLIRLARKLKKKYSTGWDMFTYQGQIVLENILERKIPAEVLKKHVMRGLSAVVK